MWLEGNQFAVSRHRLASNISPLPKQKTKAELPSMYQNSGTMSEGLTSY